MKKKNETKEAVIEEIVVKENGEKSEKDVLLDLHKTLKDLGVNSISDLEVKISRL